jgi:hypothetical protein
MVAYGCLGIQAVMIAAMVKVAWKKLDHTNGENYGSINQ